MASLEKSLYKQTELKLSQIQAEKRDVEESIAGLGKHADELRVKEGACLAMLAALREDLPEETKPQDFFRNRFKHPETGKPRHYLEVVTELLLAKEGQTAVQLAEQIFEPKQGLSFDFQAALGSLSAALNKADVAGSLYKNKETGLFYSATRAADGMFTVGQTELTLLDGGANAS